MVNEWIDVFRTGKHTSSQGDETEYTTADIDTIVANYDAVKHEAPVVIGHPKADAPAYGWVAKLRREGEFLQAMLKDVVPEFIEAVKQGLYKKRSISLYPDKTLRHVGFLGALPPSVKALRDIAFSDDKPAKVYEYNEEKKENEEMPDPQTNQPPSNENETLRRAVEEAVALKTENETLKKKVSELEEMLAELAEKTAAQETESYCEQLVKDGKITPAQKGGVKILYDTLKHGNKDFSEQKNSPELKVFNEFLASLKGVDYSEKVPMQERRNVMGAAGVDKDRLDLHERALNYMEKNNSITYEQALELVRRK